MNESVLSPKAREILEAYKNVPIGKGCETPYFNNARAKIMGGLSAFVGKGTPHMIAEEAEIISLKTRKAIKELPREELKRFLVDHGLGVDCSGFAFHVLSAEYKARKGGRLSPKIRVEGSIIRKLKKIIRPAESINVTALSLEKNSVAVDIDSAAAGDFIVFLGTGKGQTYNHILVITAVRRKGNGLVFSYAHSYAWPSEGRYGHGVREGEIVIADAKLPLTKALWTEKGFSGKDNYTLQSALEAETVSIRRLKALVS